MRIEDMTRALLKKASERDLNNLRVRFINIYQKYFDGNTRKSAIGLEREDFVMKYIMLMEEMKQRGMKLSSWTGLDERTKDRIFKRAVWGLDVPELGDHVIVENYMAIGGSFVKSPRDAEDVDIIVRDSESNRDEGMELKVGRLINGMTEKDPHFVYAPKGPHSSYIPIFDLVLRARPQTKRIDVVEKSDKEYYAQLEDWDKAYKKDNDEVISRLADGSVLDLGCGSGKLLKMLADEGREIMGIDNNETALGMCEDKGVPAEKCNLDKEDISLDDKSFDNVICVHTIEHLEYPEKLIRDACNLAKKKVIILSPLGKRLDPRHKQEFKTVNDFGQYFGRQWTVKEIEESNSAIAIREFERKEKAALKPFGKFTPPKPTMAGLTEAFSIDEIWGWAEKRLPLDVEEKLNGFRCIAEKKGDKIRIKTEGNKDRTKQFKELIDVLKKIPDDFMLDCSMGIERGGKALPRIKLMTLMADRPELEEGDIIKATLFDIPYLNEDVHGKPLSERRKKLESFYNKHLKGSKHFSLTSFNIVKTRKELESQFKKLSKLPQSEGIMIKQLDGIWDTDGSCDTWAKLKREAEIKVIALERHSVAGGNFNYTCGLLPGDSDYANLTEFRDKKYIDLGKCYNTKLRAEPGDILTMGVEEIIPEDNELSWLGARVIDIDKDRKEPYFANQAIDIARRANVLQKGAKRGIYLVKPHGTMIMDKEKTMIVKKRPLPKEYLEDVYLVEDKQVLGILNLEEPTTISQKEFEGYRKAHRITEKEAKRWGFDKASELYAYGFKIVKEFDPPIGYDPPPGVQTVIREVDISKAKTEGTVGEAGNVDFKVDDKGIGVVQIHIMGIEEEKVEDLKKYPNRIIVSRSDPKKLEAALKSIIGEQGVHVDLRLKPAGKSYWEGGEVMVGNVSGLSKLEKLKQKNKKLRFGWKVGRKTEGGKQTQIVRGPLSWMEAGKRKIEIFEPGSVGATANKYAALLNIDSFNWELYKSDEHAKKFRFTGGRYFDGNFLFAYVPVAEGGRVWMVSRLADDDHEKEEEIEKLDLESFRAEGIDDDLANPKKRYRELMADLRYLGNSGYPKLSDGEEWGKWTLTDCLKYYAKIVDVLRSIYFPIIPPKIGDPKYKTSYWECYRKAKKHMKSSPPEESDIKDWDEKREKLLKGGFVFKIYKIDKKQQVVGGIVYEPDVIDSQGDYTDAKEIEKAMQKFMIKYADNTSRIKVSHKGKRYRFPIIESYIPEVDTKKGGKTIRAGSWWIMIKIPNKYIWSGIEQGLYTGFSMGGSAKGG